MRRGSRPESPASWSWYSNSEVDLMLMSRKRANSFELAAPHPSTMLKAIDSAAVVIWDLSDPRSLRGNLRIPRRTASTSPCALSHTNRRLKSCISAFSTYSLQKRRPFPATVREPFRDRSLITTDNCPTDQPTTQNLHSLRRTPNHTRRYSARMQQCLR